MILSVEKYLELTSCLAAKILNNTYLDEILTEDENGDIRYTEEAQEQFNEHLDMVCAHLTAHGIHKENDQ